MNDLSDDDLTGSEGLSDSDVQDDCCESQRNKTFENDDDDDDRATTGDNKDEKTILSKKNQTQNCQPTTHGIRTLSSRPIQSTSCGGQLSFHSSKTSDRSPSNANNIVKTEGLSKRSSHQNPISYNQGSAIIATRKQGWTCSCGSASLLCIVIELDTPIVKKMDIRLDRNSELRLYNLARAERNDGPGGKVGMCYPNGLIHASKLLGLEPTVYFDPSIGLRLLAGRYGVWYRNLIQRQLDWCQKHNIRIIHEKYDLDSCMDRDERLLKCLAPLHLFSLHWVMVRPNGTVMDPHLGRNYDTVRLHKRCFCHNGTGLTISFKKKKLPLSSTPSSSQSKLIHQPTTITTTETKITQIGP